MFRATLCSSWGGQIVLFIIYTHYYIIYIRDLLEKYPTFGREKETGLLGALDT